MILDYNKQEMFTMSLQIDDIGNTAVKCTNDDLQEYYIITKTVFGKTHLLKVGPLMADLPVFLDNFSVQYKKIDYKEAKIIKEFNLFINDAFKKITEAEEILPEQVYPILPNIAEVFMNIE